MTEEMKAQTEAQSEVKTTAQTTAQTEAAAAEAEAGAARAEQPAGESKKEKKHSEKLEEKLRQMEEEAARQEERYKRVLAEYDNFRKRTLKEKETTWQEAQMAAVAAFLPVLDNLERGAAQENADEGIKLILKQFREILDKYHVEVCGEEGQPFDPNYHNAVLHEEGEGTGETVIAQVLQKGYTMSGKLIRAAMVKTTG